MKQEVRDLEAERDMTELNFKDYVEQVFSSESAKTLWHLAQTMDVNEWWSRLGKFSR